MMESYTTVDFNVLDGFVCLKVLELGHDTYMAEHFGIQKTLGLVT